MQDLEGKVAIVTGAARSTGAGIDRTLELSWILCPTEASRIQGESVSMVGHWRIPAAN